MAGKWTSLADEKTLTKTAKALEKNNIGVFIAENRAEALEKVKGLIPAAAEVMTGTSTTLSEIGFMDYLNSGAHKWKNVHTELLKEGDATKRQDMRRKSSVAEYFIAGVNAITEDGKLVAVDASGSRVTAFPFAAKNLILVAGTQKITRNLEEAMRRVREHVFPLENERANKEYGSGSAMSKWVIIEKDAPGRTKLVLVKETLGF